MRFPSGLVVLRGDAIGPMCLPRDAVDLAYINAASGWKVSETEPLQLQAAK